MAARQPEEPPWQARLVMLQREHKDLLTATGWQTLYPLVQRVDWWQRHGRWLPPRWQQRLCALGLRLPPQLAELQHALLADTASLAGSPQRAKPKGRLKPGKKLILAATTLALALAWWQRSGKEQPAARSTALAQQSTRSPITSQSASAAPKPAPITKHPVPSLSTVPASSAAIPANPSLPLQSAPPPSTNPPQPVPAVEAPAQPHLPNPPPVQQPPVPSPAASRPATAPGSSIPPLQSARQHTLKQSQPEPTATPSAPPPPRLISETELLARLHSRSLPSTGSASTQKPQASEYDQLLRSLHRRIELESEAQAEPGLP